METAVSTFKKLKKKPQEAYDIPGVTKVVLSPITQKAIGCVVGKDVTEKEPFIYINKEDIDLQSETSEFLQMKKEIQDYPEKDLLLVYDTKTTSNVQKTEQFFVCVTTDAKDIMLNTMEKQNKELKLQLRKYVEKNPRYWKSMGSEIEINDTLLKNLRPLFVIDIDSDWPIYTKKIRFSMKRAQDLNDGYIEIKQGHIPIENIYRKRIDAAVQASSKTNSSEAQTNPSYPVHTWTAYKYDYPEQIIDLEKETKITASVEKAIPILDDKIRVNQNINFYEKDYSNLVKKQFKAHKLTGREQIYLHHVIACKNKKVSAVAWHPLISGLIAVVYSKVSYTELNINIETVDDTLETIYKRNLVLLWDYRNTHEPKLYLRAHREIKCINFCIYNPNILIAGCENGQIVIWDLTNKITNNETKIRFTEKQQKHRLIMYSIMNWVKNIPDVTVIDPVVVSNINYGHRASIMDIKWLPSNVEITESYKITPVDTNTNMQFLTCGLDSTVYLWNLNMKSLEQFQFSDNKKPLKRLKKYPIALISKTSAYRPFHNLLVPQLKFSISEAINKAMFPLINITMINEFHNFDALNPETLDDNFQQSYFKLKMKQNLDFIPKFILTTNTGQLLKCSLQKKIEDDNDEIDPHAISEECYTFINLSVHDGPIRTCQKNPFIPEIILTVGGRVFGIWNEFDEETAPLMWRKSKYRYLSGLWSTYEPHIIVLFRQDSHFEIWDLLEQSNKPNYVIRYVGNVITDAFGSTSDKHARKNSYCTADTKSVIKIYELPQITNNKSTEELIKQLKEEFQKQINIRKNLKGWAYSWQTKYIKISTAKKEIHQKIYSKTESRQGEIHEQKEPIKKLKFDNVDKQSAEKWNAKEEKIMYKVILDKYKLDLQEIEQDKQPLLQIAEHQLNKEMKIFDTLQKKNEAFEHSKKVFFSSAKFTKRQTETCSDKISSYTKDSLLSNFRKTEEKTLDFIKSNRYQYSFNWLNMIANSKSIQPKWNSRLNKIKK